MEGQEAALAPECQGTGAASGSEAAFAYAVPSHTVCGLNHLMLKNLEIQEAAIGRISTETWKN